MNRRTLLWTVPVATIAVAAPAFAVSEAPICFPAGCRRPNKKTYFVRPGNRGDVTVLKVVIDDTLAVLDPEHGYTIRRADARSKLPVVITTTHGEWTGQLDFPVCEEKR